MAINVSQMLPTLGDILEAMAPYCGGSVPPVSDSEYSNWVSWINQAQEDAAQRAFWGRLLTHADVTFTEDDSTLTLPANFHKRNGIYVLIADGVDWADTTLGNDQGLFVNLNTTTGVWQVELLGYYPTADQSASLWYFFLPPKMSLESDKVFLDGKMLLYYALAEYYRQSGELGSLDDARAEYNNRFSELLAVEQLPTRQELVSFSSAHQALGMSNNERPFYAGRSRRWRR